MRSIYDKHNIYVSTPDWFKDADLTQSPQTSSTTPSISTGAFISSSTDFKSIPIDNQTIVWENELLHVPIDNDKLIIKDGKLTISLSPTEGDDDPNMPDLSAYATLDYVNNSFVTIGPPYQEITGEKNFKGGLKVNGGEIVYNSTDKYWKLDGDLLITGGITMYGNDSDFEASTIMDAIKVDNTTISKDGGILKVIGGTGNYQSNVQIVSSLPAESNRTPNTLYIIIG